MTNYERSKYSRDFTLAGVAMIINSDTATKGCEACPCPCGYRFGSNSYCRDHIEEWLRKEEVKK